ncbi:NAD(P)/FAD-dependent oxidoreductase [Maribacter sp. 2307ULW6-5]|uniref:NAD(P)/FAD-dependent oxidoreductase n=1 Tax=Maribacter sp. 2307ULW6-5 TaxID=3386275 RepID=UPI0039BD8B31
MREKRMVIIGGGFAGIHLAKQLQGVTGIQVTLVDKNNYNFFTPLLYQVAAGLLDVSSICIPFRTLFKGRKNLQFKMGTLERVLPDANAVVLSTGTLTYDYLVMATGTQSNYFGMENIRKYALPMKSVEEATQLRNYLLREAERYVNTEDEDERKKMRNIVISGAGPSGVEIAGILAEMRNRIMQDIYPELDHKSLNIFLVDGGDSVLPPFRERSRNYALEQLKALGIRVQLNKMVTDYRNDVVHFEDGDRLPTKTLIWTAGVIAHQFQGLPENSYTEGNRLQVDAHYKVAHTKNIYAIGDACLQTSDPDFPEGHPQLASVAQQQGRHLAKNIMAILDDRPPKIRTYKDKGTMAIIGRSKAVADMHWPKTSITGWFAWAAWLFVHLFLLLNYRNKLKTGWNWAITYFGKARSQGIMLGEYPKRDLRTHQKEAPSQP